MVIEFFKKQEKFDTEAVKPGVYIVKLGVTGDRDSMKPLYIGESYSMVSRCGRHLYELYKDPSYFGLQPQHITNDSLCIVFEVYEELEKETAGMDRTARDILLKGRELKALQQIDEPTLTQTRTSDHVTRDRSKRVEQFITGLMNK